MKSTWPEPIAAGAAGAAVLSELWTRADRVDAAVADDRQLRDFADADGADGGPRVVRIVTCSRPTLELPARWRCQTVKERPVPEFMLFYPTGSSFPECAVVHAGGSSADGWFTVHRRPFILNRLRERFEALAKTAVRHPHFAASNRLASALPTGSVREELTPSSDDTKLEIVSPQALYRQVLAVHFAEADRGRVGVDRSLRGPSLAAHQQRAFERACDVVDRYGGVIVADSVGLGKTFIGLRLLERALDSGGRALVIVPAALKPQWLRELAYLRSAHGAAHPVAARRLRLTDSSAQTAAARHGASDPDVDETLDLWVREDANRPLALLSMESLGRRGFDASAHQGLDLVLVDEAHNFRNPSTRRFRALSEIVRHSQLVMLTATPINNSILDLRHLIDLFAAPGAFRHLGVPDYREAFRRAAAGEGDVKAIVAACVVRRTRRFVRRHYPTITIRDPLSGGVRDLRFPKREPPVAVDYDLAGTYGNVFSHIHECLDELRFPVVDPTPPRSPGSEESEDATQHPDLEPDDAPHASAELLKIVLLKRLESSVAAFRCTVIQQLAWCSTALRAIEAGRVLSRPDYRATFRGPADDPGSQLAFFELMLPAPSIDARRLARLRRTLEHDQAILAHIHAALSTVGIESDLKLRSLLELLDGPHAGRKTLIFTEFRDTARYLYHQLKDRPHVAQIDSGGARLGLDPARRREVIQRFAPRSNGLPEPPRRERVDLLIATDVLSEGLNLQDATAVISYDLPWNPVRLMQRSGRIDRLGSVAESIALHHFVPARDLERLLGLMGRLQRKLRTIQRTLGLDHPVLAASAPGAGALDQIRALASDPASYDELESEMEGPLDLEEQAYIDGAELLGKAEGAASQFAALASDAVAVSMVVDDRRVRAGAVAYWRLEGQGVDRALWLVYDRDTGCVVEDQSSALAAFRQALESELSAPSDEMIEAARQPCARYARGVAAQVEAARIAGDSLSPGLPQCRIAAWLSRVYLASAPRLTPDERRAIDRLHSRLARRFTAAAERSLAELAGELPDGLDSRFLSKLEETLGRLDADRRAPIRLREVALLLRANPQ